MTRTEKRAEEIKEILHGRAYVIVDATYTILGAIKQERVKIKLQSVGKSLCVLENGMALSISFREAVNAIKNKFIKL